MLSHRMIIISHLYSPARALSLHCLDLNTTGSPDVPRCVFIWYFSQLWIIRVSYSPWMRRGRWISYHQSALHEMTVQVAFPHSLVGKASACNAEGPSLIPGLGRSLGEGTGCLLQYSWASRMAQLGKNLPAMHETWVPSLCWEDPLEKGKAIHSSILAWRIPLTV